MRVLYYGLGGGHGHAVRGLALLRRLPELRPDASVLLLAPGRLNAWAKREAIPCEHPPAGADKAGLGAWAAEAAGRFQPDLILVDFFPRGVLGELGPGFFAGRRAWLVARGARAGYYLTPEVREAIETRYEGVLWAEEPSHDLDGIGRRSERTGPILIRRPDECLSREEARGELGVSPAERLVILLGEPDLARVVQKALARIRAWALLRVWADSAPPFPAMRLLRAADAVVCGAGYHSFNEVRALGVPAVFVPRNRLYDEQDRRAADSITADSPQALESGLRRALAQPPRPAGPFVDGARRAWELILAPPKLNAKCPAEAGTGRSLRMPSGGVPS